MPSKIILLNLNEAQKLPKQSNCKMKNTVHYSTIKEINFSKNVCKCSSPKTKAAAATIQCPSRGFFISLRLWALSRYKIYHSIQNILRSKQINSDRSRWNIILGGSIQLRTKGFDKNKSELHQSIQITWSCIQIGTYRTEWYNNLFILYEVKNIHMHSTTEKRKPQKINIIKENSSLDVCG